MTGLGIGSGVLSVIATTIIRLTSATIVPAGNCGVLGLISANTPPLAGVNYVFR
jgi:hypothetical protein